MLQYPNNFVSLCCFTSNTMPRQARKTSGTGIYHVMLRGINRQDIFEDDEDYMQFLRSLHQLVECCDERGYRIPSLCHFYAYCLMPNHVHLLIQEKTAAIGEIVSASLFPTHIILIRNINDICIGTLSQVHLCKKGLKII